MTAIVILAATIIGAIIHLFVSKAPRTIERVVEVFLLYFLVIGVGMGSLFAALGHLFAADEVAESIGWPTGSPFQFELGAANLGLGIAGVMCAWKRGSFWTATAIIASVFLFMDGIGHIRETINGDHAEYNSGPILYTDFIIAIVTMGLVAAKAMLERRGPEVERREPARA